MNGCRSTGPTVATSSSEMSPRIYSCDISPERPPRFISSAEQRSCSRSETVAKQNNGYSDDLWAFPAENKYATSPGRIYRAGYYSWFLEMTRSWIVFVSF